MIIMVRLIDITCEKAIQALVEVQSKCPDKGCVIPGAGIGVVPEAGKVENFRATFHCMENFFREIWIAVLEGSEDKHEGLEGDDPVASLAKAFGNGLRAGRRVGFVGGNEEEDFIDVALVDGDFVVGGRPEDQHLEVGAGVGARNLGEADAGLVFHCAKCLP